MGRTILSPPETVWVQSAFLGRCRESPFGKRFSSMDKVGLTDGGPVCSGSEDS